MKFFILVEKALTGAFQRTFVRVTVWRKFRAWVNRFMASTLCKTQVRPMGLWRPLERWSFSASCGKTPFLCLSWSGQVDSAQQPTPREKYVHMQYVCRKYVANFSLTQEFQAICSRLVLVLCWWNVLRRSFCVALTGPELTAVLLRLIPPLVTF